MSFQNVIVLIIFCCCDRRPTTATTTMGRKGLFRLTVRGTVVHPGRGGTVQNHGFEEGLSVRKQSNQSHFIWTLEIGRTARGIGYETQNRPQWSAFSSKAPPWRLYKLLSSCINCRHTPSAHPHSILVVEVARAPTNMTAMPVDRYREWRCTTLETVSATRACFITPKQWLL